VVKGDEVSYTSWACAQVWSKANTSGRDLRLLAISRNELLQLPRIQNCAFGGLFFIGDSLKG
ncbi:hypothetical protein ACQP3L_34675, partial [Escherichia coli]